ncbi:MAG: adenylyl cyclase, partial [Myxococcota bacterium]
MANLVSELRRRNVFRVAGLYLVVSWLLLQLAAFLEDALKLPDWFDGMVTALVLLGFPVALILAWAFELTPDGVRRTAASESSAPVRPVDWVLVVLLTFVSGMLVWSRVDPPYQEGSAAPSADVGAVPKDVAVAVLPFADLSPEGDQNYFSDGLAEELLNVLRRDAGIRVAGRTSSFAFKGKGAGVQQIAESLNVTHVVEGSVRKAGERIRVSVQLINAADGFPVFSESYDRKLEDIFAVQDDIARSVGRALQLRFSLSERNPPDDVGAYEDYLTARELLYTRVVPNMVKASTLLGSAIDRAPSYAPAYATKAVATMLLSNMQGGYGERESREALAEAKTFIDRALELDPQLP